MLATTIVLCVFLGIAINVEGKAKCNPDTYYKGWKDLTDKQWKYAGKLNWNEKNWNLISGPSVTATLPYDYLVKTDDNEEEIQNTWGKWKPSKEKKIKKALKKMGLKVEGKKCYDKYISNYAKYSWDDLPTKSKKSYKKLGWNESSWMGESEKPDYTCLYYNDLTKKQKKHMKNVGYPEDKWGGNWRWDEYPTTDLVREADCNNVRCEIYPEQYNDDCKYIYDMDDYCLNTSKDWYKDYYKKEDGECVAKSSCELYGDYYMCEETLVESWCDENCFIVDKCKCESSSSSCEDCGSWFESVNGTCQPKDWCDIFTGCYQDDISSVVEEDYEPFFEKC